MARKSKKQSIFKGVDWKTLIGLLGLMLVVVILWDTIFVYPLKILVVFFHELSHGVMAVLTGGRVVGIQVNALQGGLCVTEGGNRFLTLSAGYLGSLVWGGFILLSATRGKKQQQATLGLGVLMVLVSLLYVRPWFGFGFIFAILIGAALIYAGLKLNRDWNVIVLKVIGLTSCLYAVLDIRDDILARPGAMSDARMLAELTHIPTFIWGGLWFLSGLIAAGYFLLTASKRR